MVCLISVFFFRSFKFGFFVLSVVDVCEKATILNTCVIRARIGTWLITPQSSVFPRIFTLFILTRANISLGELYIKSESSVLSGFRLFRFRLFFESINHSWSKFFLSFIVKIAMRLILVESFSLCWITLLEPVELFSLSFISFIMKSSTSYFCLWFMSNLTSLREKQIEIEFSTRMVLKVNKMKREKYFLN